MKEEIEVQTTVGKWILKRPKAGVRNRALAKAETDAGTIKQTVFMTELLPKCIKERPEGMERTIPIEHILDDLTIEDYDLLFVSLLGLVQLHETDEKKTP